MARNIVQIQLLDPNTGSVIETVIPETEAKAVLLANGTDLQSYISSLVLQKGDKGDRGDTGAQGIAGTPGTKLFNVTAAPATGLGVVGDWALNTTNGDVYEKTGAAAWTNRGNFKGPKGDTGAQGIPGLKGDQGIKGDTGIQGPKGDAGAQGPTGATGASGSTGPQGPKGDTGATGSQGPKGEKGDSGENLKYGTTYAGATQVSLFFKKV